MFCPGEIRKHSMEVMMVMMMKLMLMAKISEYLQYADSPHYKERRPRFGVGKRD